MTDVETDPEAAPVGRRERRKAETRRRLMAAAQQLVAEKGVAAVRISDVSDRAEVGFGTFYTYFDSKDALIEAVVEAAVSTAAEDIGTDASLIEDPAEAVAASFLRFVRFADESPEVARILVHLTNADALFEQALLTYARDVLQRGLASGRLEIPAVEVALTQISAAALATMRGRLDGRFGPEAAAAGAVLWLRAFGLDHATAQRLTSTAQDRLGATS